MIVHLHIDRLVVDAGLAGDPAALQAGIIAALAERIEAMPQPGWWHNNGSIVALHATLPLTSSNTPFGARVGFAIHDSLSETPVSGQPT